VKARSVLQMAEAAVGALETIEKLTHIGGDKAEAALAAIRGVIHTIDQGFAGELSPQAVLSQAETFHAHVATGDAAALELLKRRFNR
jgi:hypothetical protein